MLILAPVTHASIKGRISHAFFTLIDLRADQIVPRPKDLFAIPLILGCREGEKPQRGIGIYQAFPAVNASVRMNLLQEEFVSFTHGVILLAVNFLPFQSNEHER